MRNLGRLLFLSIFALVGAGSSCPQSVQDAKVATLYIGQGEAVTKKASDVDGNAVGTLYNQGPGRRVVAHNVKIHSTVDFALVTYLATKIFSRDATGGSNQDLVRIYRESIGSEPIQIMNEFVASVSSNPALAVSNDELFVVWMGMVWDVLPTGLRRAKVKRSSDGRRWRDAGEFLLDESLHGIDIVPFGNNLLLGGFQNNSVVVYEIRLSPPGVVEKFSVADVDEMEPVGQVSLAIRNDTVLVLFGQKPTLANGEYCNLGNVCRSQQCTQGVCAGTEPPVDDDPGFMDMHALSVSGGTRGNYKGLWSSGYITDLQWVSGARITEASDEPDPNDYVVAAFRGRRVGGQEIFLCKWPWPAGTSPDWTLSPPTCPQFLELNDSNLQSGYPTFDINADTFVRSRRD